MELRYWLEYGNAKQQNKLVNKLLSVLTSSIFSNRNKRIVRGTLCLCEVQTVFDNEVHICDKL